MKIINVLFVFLFIGCEFRPANVYLQSYEENTKCVYPIPSIGLYDLDESYLILCEYNSSKRIKEEKIFNALNLNQTGLITYKYKTTYYIKTIYDYEFGSPELNYIVDSYYVNKERD